MKIEIKPIFRKNANFEKHGCIHSYVNGPFRTSRQNRNCLWNIYTKKLYDDNFCFEKYYPHWKLLTLIRPLHLTTLAFVNGKNNGFTTNDWQEKLGRLCTGQSQTISDNPFVALVWKQLMTKFPCSVFLMIAKDSTERPSAIA